MNVESPLLNNAFCKNRSKLQKMKPENAEKVERLSFQIKENLNSRNDEETRFVLVVQVVSDFNFNPLSLFVTVLALLVVSCM